MCEWPYLEAATPLAGVALGLARARGGTFERLLCLGDIVILFVAVQELRQLLHARHGLVAACAARSVRGCRRRVRARGVLCGGRSMPSKGVRRSPGSEVRTTHAGRTEDLTHPTDHYSIN